MRDQISSSQMKPGQITRFYRLWFGLLQYTNEQYKIVTVMLGKDFHQGIKTEDAGKIAKYIWTNPKVFQEFIIAARLSKPESEIVSSWGTYHIRNKFYIVKYIKDGAVFLSSGRDGKLYLVKGLVSNFEEMWPKQALPVLVETVLLPFENVITTSGLYYGFNIFLGKNISRELRENCEQLELTYGLITSLPYTHTISKEDKDIAQIKFYLHSEKNLNFYREELENFINKKPEKYLTVYYYYRGQLQAKSYKREYRKLGIKKLNFAFYGSLVIAAHPDKRQVENTVKKLVSTKELGRIVYDHV